MPAERGDKGALRIERATKGEDTTRRVRIVGRRGGGGSEGSGERGARVRRPKRDGDGEARRRGETFEPIDCGVEGGGEPVGEGDGGDVGGGGVGFCGAPT